MTAIAIQHRDLILSELRKGKRLSDIAPTLGVSYEAISKPLREDPEYRAAIEDSFEVRIDKAEDQIQAAVEQVDVSRARAYHDAIKWRAGVETTKYQLKQHITMELTVELGDRLRRARERVIAPLQPESLSTEQVEEAQVIDC